MESANKKTPHIFALACVAFAISVAPVACTLMPAATPYLGSLAWTKYNLWGWIPALYVTIYALRRKRELRPSSKFLSFIVTVMLWAAFMMNLVWVVCLIGGFLLSMTT